MYPEVKGEMARKNITLAMIANDPRVDCTVSTLSVRRCMKVSLLSINALEDLIEIFFGDGSGNA